MTGLWLLHECRRTWALEGREHSFDELVALAEDAPPLRSLIDPNDAALRRTRATCRRASARSARETGSRSPPSPAPSCAASSRASRSSTRRRSTRCASVTGAAPAEMHVVGGGARNELLCRWTADAAGLPVLAGPEEATLLGNLLVQAMALGELARSTEAREVVRASFAPTIYEPHDSARVARGAGAVRAARRARRRWR